MRNNRSKGTRANRFRLFALIACLYAIVSVGMYSVIAYSTKLNCAATAPTPAEIPTATLRR